MDYRKCIADCLDVAEMVNRWESEGTVKEIERRIALNRLADAYDFVTKISGAEEVDQPTHAAIEESVADNNTKANEQSQTASEEVVAEQTTPMVAPRVVPAVETYVEPKEQPQAAEEPKEQPSTAVEEVAETAERQSDAEQRPIVDQAAEKEQADSTKQPEPQQDNQSQQQATITPAQPEEVRFAPHNVDRRIIRAIYDDEPADLPTTPHRQELSQSELRPSFDEAQQPNDQEGEESRPTVEPYFVINESVDEHQSEAEHTQSQKPRTVNDTLQEPQQVLGEVIANQTVVLGESIKGQTLNDVAERIVAANCKELTDSIGINDRFMMIAELFGGDNDKYSTTIARLDSCHTLDEALLYIYDHFEWDSESEATKRLMELLTRKFA